MALYGRINLGAPTPIDAREYEPSFFELVSQAYSEALKSNPLQIINCKLEMAGLDPFDFNWPDAGSPIDPHQIIDVDKFAADSKRNAIPLAEQERLIRDAGLEGQLKPVEGYRREAQEIVIENKRAENLAAILHENAGMGKTLAASLPAGLAAGMFDPVNIGSAFFPVIRSSGCCRFWATLPAWEAGRPSAPGPGRFPEEWGQPL